MRQQSLVCVGCPLGCHVILKISDKDEIETLQGNKCKEGKEYVIAEFRAPVRIFTTTVRTERGGRLLPVRTDKPVHKGQLKELIQACAKLRVEPPVRIGQVIIHNVLGTGANLIASMNL